MEKPPILLLTSTTGGGHVSLAKALADGLQTEFTTEIVDPQPGILASHYRFLSRYARWLWSLEFHASNTPDRARRAHQLYTAVMGERLGQLIAEKVPAGIVATYPFFTYAVQHVCRKLQRDIPLIVLFTDPQSVHQAFLTVTDAELTLTPTAETYHQAIEANFRPESTLHCGWPVRRIFHDVDADSIQQVRSGLGFSTEKLTIFLQGGGEGAAKFTKTVDELLGHRRRSDTSGLQLILAVGSNRALQNRYESLPDCHVLPYTDNIAPYMAAADLVMGKAGPNFLFESVTLGKPFVATTYIPGQEQENLGLIEKYGLGWCALTPEARKHLLQQILQEPETLRHMQHSVQAYAQENAALNQRILPAIRGLL